MRQGLYRFGQVLALVLAMAWCGSIDHEAYGQGNNAATQLRGQVRPANGGTGVDTSAISGTVCPHVTSGTWAFSSAYCAAGGSVTSVGLTAPSIFSVSGSPVTGSGTLGFTLVSQTQGTFLGAPCSSSGTPVFRAICSTDIPTNLSAYIQTSPAAYQSIVASYGAALGFDSRAGGGDLFVIVSNPGRAFFDLADDLVSNYSILTASADGHSTHNAVLLGVDSCWGWQPNPNSNYSPSSGGAASAVDTAICRGAPGIINIGTKVNNYAPIDNALGSLNALNGTFSGTVAAAAMTSGGSAVCTAATGCTGGGGGVLNLNGLTGSLSIAAGTGTSVSASGTTITISATGGGTVLKTTVTATVPNTSTCSNTSFSFTGLTSTMAIAGSTNVPNTGTGGSGQYWFNYTSPGVANLTLCGVVGGSSPSLTWNVSAQ